MTLEIMNDLMQDACEDFNGDGCISIMELQRKLMAKFMASHQYNLTVKELTSANKLALHYVQIMLDNNLL